ncbi:MAG: hypothetical protein ACYDH0_11930 [Candidatus Aminicenantales bacterium]
MLAAVVFSALAVCLSADWRTDVMSLLDPQRDFSGALAYLHDVYPSRIDDQDKPNALAMLAFLADKAGEAEQSRELAVDYFETYKDNDPGFDYLNDSLFREFVAFWGGWKRTYPLITNILFLERPDESESFPPLSLEVGLDLLNPGYYKISRGGSALEGGFWQAGYHILRLPVTSAYDGADRADFDLDLRTGAMVVRKRISVVIGIQESATPTLLPRRSNGARDPRTPPRPVEGEVSLFIGDKLILTSQKLSSRPSPIVFKLPGPSAPGTKPYMAPRRDDPMLNQVSILDAVATIYDVLKDLGKKKKAAAAEAPAYQKTAQRAFSFTRAASDGTSVRIKASLSLETAAAAVLKE